MFNKLLYFQIQNGHHAFFSYYAFVICQKYVWIISLEIKLFLFLNLKFDMNTKLHFVAKSMSINSFELTMISHFFMEQILILFQK